MLVPVGIALTLLTGCHAGPADAQPGSRSPAPLSRSVAVTLDDVPAVATTVDPCDAEGLVALTDRLLDGLAEFDVPATALVTGSRVCDPLRETLLPQILERWLQSGHAVGNHTFSHRDLNGLSAAAFMADVDRNAALLRPALEAHGQALRYFRHPLLHSGDSEEKKSAVDAALAERGYRVAPVTLDSQEWVYAAVYADARRAGDRQRMLRVADDYVRFMESVVAYFEDRAVRVLGYEPPQVLLLHANDLNADHFASLARMLVKRGYRFVSLDRALDDPAYSRGNPYVGRRGLSWIHRWGLADGLPPDEEPREPEWIAEQMAAIRP